MSLYLSFIWADGDTRRRGELVSLPRAIELTP
jgi:hypothetical protein